MRFQDIPESGEIVVNGKKMMWYHYYTFTEEQEKQWKDWCVKQIEDHKGPLDMVEIDLLYGFPLSYKKKGELF